MSKAASKEKPLQDLPVAFLCVWLLCILLVKLETQIELLVGTTALCLELWQMFHVW